MVLVCFTMPSKRKFDRSAYDVGQSSRSSRTRRIPNRGNLMPPDTLSASLYFDDGDCEYICEHCSALFWFAERIVHRSLYDRPRYTHCCKNGVVRLPLPLSPPSVIRDLFEDSNFMENVRAYNNMFSMTSFGARIDEAVNDGRGPYVFKVSGQLSHWIGSIWPPDNEHPRFLQLYIYDTENEVPNRLRFFQGSDHRNLSPAVVKSLADTFKSSNEYVRLFKSAKDLCDTSGNSHFSVRLYNNLGDRRYEPPAVGTLGGIVYADDPNACNYDIVVHNKGGTPHRVSKLHSSYIPLQYPLLFPFAEPGWSPSLKLHSVSEGRRHKLTVNMYYSFQIHDRHNVYSLLLRGGRLFQQYLVDAYTCIEQGRLDFVNANQNLFRSEFVAGLYDALARGDNNAHDIGKRVFLPSSFTGGPRYMYKHYQDALAICRVHGNPQYFITFTCNVKWPEISRHLEKIGGTLAQNRPDIISRVFHIKVQQFLRFMRASKTFGQIIADLYTIEFQKRGLPHCHTLIWVTPAYRVSDAVDVDKYISAEIPDPSTEPVLHKIVTDYMIHGPCGLARPMSPCMRDSKCSKSFPKMFECNTRFDKDGYVHYRRRDSPHRASKNGILLDNRYVVPYNRDLCSHFNAHINVEHCGWNMMIKYLFKYISKGADRVRFCISRSQDASAVHPDCATPAVNEVQNFVDGRYICPHEASWRILNFPIHERTPAVEILVVHLENMQNVTFKENLKLQAIVRNPSFGKTTLTEWIQSNKRDRDGLHLTYVNYCSKYRWCKKAVAWLPRVQLQNPAIGRLAYVHPASGELFYMRMLLSHQCGCKSFADIRTVSGVLHSTYRSACDSLGLLGEDREWLTAFEESSSWATSSEIRVLFVHMLLFCEQSTCYDRTKLASEHCQSLSMLNSEQLQILCLRKLHRSNSGRKAHRAFRLHHTAAVMLQSKRMHSHRLSDIHGYCGPRRIFGDWKKARFDPAPDLSIPDVYFNFATYDALKNRVKNARLLTDYIGRVETNSLRTTRTGKILRKILIRDEMKKDVEITLWPDKGHLIGDEVIPGDIVAITSMMVTEHNGRLQLESTYLTTAFVNPDMPQTINHINRIKEVQAREPTGRDDQIATLQDIKLTSQQNIQTPKNFICKATIKRVHEDRTWYYVLCSKCGQKLYPQQQNNSLNFVCKDDDDIIPNFRYCVNATIEDPTGSTDTVFFNESMEAILNISCEDMVNKHADTTNPKIVPQLIRSIAGTTRLLNLTLKNDKQIVVNSVNNIASTTDTQSTSTAPGTSAFTPATPVPKSTISKRTVIETPAKDKKMKVT
ncbi:hypothetical protein CASFOL_028760 [Castilleja foliolosa]|uniref:ATP-dependent DNA helicase n=1 Tax=Castilleja foliolosa TaxID=1961234 RepID=A0ABD3CCY5_9LAMI